MDYVPSYSRNGASQLPKEQLFNVSFCICYSESSLYRQKLEFSMVESAKCKSSIAVSHSLIFSQNKGMLHKIPTVIKMLAKSAEVVSQMSLIEFTFVIHDSSIYT